MLVFTPDVGFLAALPCTEFSKFDFNSNVIDLSKKIQKLHSLAYEKYIDIGSLL